MVMFGQRLIDISPLDDVAALEESAVADTPGATTALFLRNCRRSRPDEDNARLIWDS